MNFYGKRLKEEFFMEPTLTVAKNLLGKVLVRKDERGETRVIITETEAYLGFHDKASHASRGLTPRTKLMFGNGGHAYIYLIYGMHYCFNIVTEREGYPAAVLIRGILSETEFPVKSETRFPTGKMISGPGRTAKYMNIDKFLNGEDIVESEKLWVECLPQSVNLKKSKIKSAPRVGVDYAGEWAKKPWRFRLVTSF